MAREKIESDEASFVEQISHRERTLKASIPHREELLEATDAPRQVESPAPQVKASPEAPREVKEMPKRKRGQTADYKETFLRRNEMKTRQCVYISYDVHAVIAKLVRVLVSAGNDVTVGGYIDTVLYEHLQSHKEEINEAYRQQQGDLL